MKLKEGVADHHLFSDSAAQPEQDKLKQSVPAEVQRETAEGSWVTLYGTGRMIMSLRSCSCASRELLRVSKERTFDAVASRDHVTTQRPGVSLGGAVCISAAWQQSCTEWCPLAACTTSKRECRT